MFTYISRLNQLECYKNEILSNSDIETPCVNRIVFFFISAGMMWLLATLLLVISVSSTAAEEAQVEDGEKRDAKVLPVFQVVKFPVSLVEVQLII